MKKYIFLSVTLFFFSCEKKQQKIPQKRLFIVSKFLKDRKKQHQEALSKNPELSSIKIVREYDYEKGMFNFLFLSDGRIVYYKEDLIWNWCGWESTTNLRKRILSKDSIHSIDFKEIYPLLQSKRLNKDSYNNSHILKPLIFAFENDTVKNRDIYTLLNNIDSLGYHLYDVRKIAPFEKEALKAK